MSLYHNEVYVQSCIFYIQCERISQECCYEEKSLIQIFDTIRC